MTEHHLEHTSHGPIRLNTAADTEVHRVGYAPDIWAWTPWQYAHNGRFSGHWDDPNGTFRSLYLADTRLACYLEVLAFARPDLELAAALDDIAEDPDDEREYPTLPAGRLPDNRRAPRRIGTAHLTGTFATPADAQSLPTLRSRFARLTTELGLADVDAAAIRLTEPRTSPKQYPPGSTPTTASTASNSTPVTATTSHSGHSTNAHTTTTPPRYWLTATTSQSTPTTQTYNAP